MRKLLYVSMLTIFLGQVFTSCKTPDEPILKPKAYEEYAYSELTAEQQKDKLAGEADELLKLVSDFPNLSGVLLAKNFAELLDMSNPDLFGEKEEGVDILYVKDFNGEFTWNPEMKEWNKKELAGKLVFNLPATKETTINNAKIEFSGVGSAIFADEVELPNSLNMNMSIGGASVGSLVLTATNVNSATIANTAKVEFKVDSYQIVVDVTKKDAENVESTMKFTKGGNTILEAISGTNLTINEKYISGENRKDDLAVLNTQKFEVKLTSNLALIGSVDVKNLNKEYDIIEEKYYGQNAPQWTEDTDKKYEEEIAAAENKYTKVFLVSTKDETKIADIKYVVTKKTSTYSYMTQVWDEELEEWVDKMITETNTYYNSEMVLVFGDNTEADFDTYFGKGFDDIIEAWQKFFKKFNI